jgi:hypothetical protein
MLYRVDLVKTDVSEKLSDSFIRVTRIDELGTTLAATSNRHTLRRKPKWVYSFFLDSREPLPVCASVSSIAATKRGLPNQRVVGGGW